MLQKWLKALSIYADRRMLVMTGLGFSSGFPLMLVSGTLSLWLDAAQISYALIGVFSLVKTPYSFKWLWAPVIDRVNLPLFGRLGRRRGWALFTQLVMMAAIAMMASINPAEHTCWLAAVALVVVFASASQDVVLDAFRVESFRDKEQGAAAAVFVLGYRLGLIFSGAIALWLAAHMSWQQVYLIMAGGASVGIVTVLCCREPAKDRHYKEEAFEGTRRERLKAFTEKAVVAPFRDFMRRPDWKLVLLFVFLYKMSDAYMGPMANVFYVIYKSLWICGVLQGLTTLVFVGQAYAGHNIYVLTGCITLDNVSGGMSVAAFVAYLSSLCSVAYTATQYALLSSLMSLARDAVAATSGKMVELAGWPMFFVITSLMVVPGLIILCFIRKPAVNKVAQAVGQD